MTEAELLQQLSEVDFDWQKAKRELARAKKLWTDIETNLIELKLRKESIMENLRVFNNTSPIQPPSLRELEIERFRKNNPEICTFAKERDIKQNE